ncbi:MAG: tyrosine-type recombinase/integrase [Candidatus Hodarchaeota archaeon]
MKSPPQPIPDLLNEYKRYLRTQGKAKNTVKCYLSNLRNIPKDVGVYFGNKELLGRKLKVVAYRSYLRFLAIEKQAISMNDLMAFLELIKPPKNKGNGVNERLYSIPKTKWIQYIKNAPNQVAKMGFWIGFHFGLRLGEIVHLRVDDVDFRNQKILIRPHRKMGNQELWSPKYDKERSIPFSKNHTKTLKRWINEARLKNLEHSYLLWTLQGKRKGLRVREKNFENWCEKAGKELDSRKFKPHIMRYSFATHYYEESMDVKLVSFLLGHANISTTSDYLRLDQKKSEDKARDLLGGS